MFNAFAIFGNMKSTPKVRFHFETNPFFFPNRTLVKEFIVSLCKNEGKAINQLNYIFCDDEYLLKINKEYLNHDTYTDIITFELSAKNEDLLSDIFISTERIRQNATEFNTTFLQELYRVMFHGALHLCGYKDKNQADESLMRQKEAYYLNKYIVSRGTKKKRF